MSNEHCFIERERFLAAREVPDEKPDCYYASMLADMLDEMSTPVDGDDIFVGRVLEASPDEGMAAPSRKIFAKGHLIPGYDRLLRLGFRGVLEEIRGYAEKLGTERAAAYADNAERVVEAIRRSALRYADAAEDAWAL